MAFLNEQGVARLWQNIVAKLGTKADTNHNHDDVYETKGAAAAVKDELLNGAGEAYDTLKELGELIDENIDAIEALEIVASAKPDWNQNDESKSDYVQNRTHYSIPGIDITWDGVMGDRVSLYLYSLGFGESYFVKVSDEVFTPEQLVGSQIVDTTGEITMVTENTIDSTSFPGAHLIQKDVDFWYVASVYDVDELKAYLNSAFGYNLTNGTYFLLFGDFNITSLTKEGYLRQLDEKFIPDTIARKDYVDENFALKDNVVNADWNQNDETANDYIKNRPFYDGEPKLVDVVPEATVTVNFDNGMYYAPLTDFNDSFVNGQTYIVNFNGTPYECVARESDNCVFVGNGTLPNGDGNIGNSEPFFLIYIKEFNELYFNTTAAGAYTLSVSTYTENIVQIDGRYIKDMYYDNGMVYIGSLNFIATSPNTMDYTYTNLDGNEVASYLSRLSRDGSVIQVNLDGKNGLMSTTFSRGWFSFTGILSGNMMNWNEGQIWSVTVNHPDIILSINNTYTVDFYDLSNSNIKYIDIKYLPSTVYTTYNAPIQHGSGEYSAVQGCDTIASGKESHAEGVYSTASGSTSHAEGFQTTASGPTSHSEGYHTTASGFCAHAEGYYTIAASRFQHVQGKCNIEDASNIYAHIVGNSEDDDSPSNAYTLDWSGNAWFAGDVYVGSTSGTNKDDGSKKLATEEFVNSLMSGGAYYVQDTEPTDAEDGAIWIDTANDPAFIAPNLPAVTEADNGKILMVVNGKWQAVSLNLSVDADGVVSI